MGNRLGLTSGRRTPNKDDLSPVVATLRARRYELGLSLNAVAEKVGYQANTIWCWESGRHEPPLVRIKDWAQALGMKVRIIVERDNGL